MNKLKIVFVLLLLLLVGCVNEPNNGKKSMEKYIEWVETNVPDKIVGNFVLPTTHPELGGFIAWTSYNLDVIDDTGKVTLRDGSADATLEYTISFEGEVYVGEKNVRVIKYTYEEIARKFSEQFSPIITRNYDVNVDFGPEYKIAWTSSDETVFTNTGEYIKPDIDTKFTIKYTVEFNGQSYDYTIELTAKRKSIADKIVDIKQWITTNYIKERLTSDELNLPTRYEPLGIDLEWESSNTGVISNTGKVTRFAFDRYVTLVLKFEIEGILNEVEFSLVVAAKEVTSKEEKIESLLNAVAVPEIGKLVFTAYAGMNQSYNYLPFYVNTAPVIYDSKMRDKIGGPRPGIKLYSLEFITIHDTANNGVGAGGQRHQDLIYYKINDDDTSWHFAIDETGSYQSIPVDEVAWHAGDGSVAFKLTDTGVKATVKYPVITISADGYYELNGVKSKVSAPLVSGKVAKTSDITPSGIYTEIGANGNYYINNTYYNTSYGKISNGGGNHNSIGIETCVNQGNDYAQTLRHTAQLVADLLVKNNLSVDRVLQHNNFSGKQCPNAIRVYGYWNNFLDLISLERFARSELADVTFEWTSNTSLMSNTGKISLSAKPGDVLSYSVKATFGAKTIEKQYTTKLS